MTLWVLGFAGLLQMVLLPGAALLRFLKIKGLNAIEQIVAVFTASLMINHLLVVLFVLTHLQGRAIWWIVIAAEIIYIALAWRSWIHFWSLDLQQLTRLRTLPPARVVAGLLLLASAGFFLYLLATNWGTVYNGNDDVANWDRWAVEWSSGLFPTFSSIYPQLLPASCSIPYVLMGNTDVKMFSKATAPIYGLFIVLLFLSLSIRRRDPAYLIGGVLFTVMLLEFVGPTFLSYGYADMPLAFFGFLTFYCVAAVAGRPHRDCVLAMLFFATGTLLAKQGGIFVVGAAVTYAFLWKSHPDSKLLRRDTPTSLVLGFAIFCAAWYAAKYVQIRLGTDYSNIPLLTSNLHHGRTYLQRIIVIYRAFLHARSDLSVFNTVTGSLLLVVSLFLKRTRAITAFLILPFLTAYAIWFSYEIRPALAAFPLIALVCAQTLYWMLTRLSPSGTNPIPAAICIVLLVGLLLRRPYSVDVILNDAWFSETVRFYWPPLLVLSIAALVVSSLSFSRKVVIPLGRLALLGLAGCMIWGAVVHPGNTLLAQQKQLARETIGDRALADSLYKAVREKNIHSGIMTDYWFLRGLPDIKQLFRNTTCRRPCSVEGLRDDFKAQADAGFTLRSDASLAPETRRYLRYATDVTSVFDVSGYRLIEVHRGALAAPPALRKPPELISFIPPQKSGQQGVFRFVFSEPAGPMDIQELNLIVNSQLSVSHACYLQWSRKAGTVAIAHDTGIGWAAEHPIGTVGAIANSQCEIPMPGFTIQETPASLEFDIPIRFKSSFAGARHFYGYVAGDFGQNGPYREAGVWTVSARQ